VNLFISAVGFITFVDSLLSAFPGQALCSTVPRSFFLFLSVFYCFSVFFFFSIAFVLCIIAAPRVRIKILIKGRPLAYSLVVGPKNGTEK